MKQDIINYDKQGRYHGEQIEYYSNGNVFLITHNYHNKWNGYRAWFKRDKSIHFKQYWKMSKLIYIEDHGYEKININI